MPIPWIVLSILITDQLSKFIILKNLYPGESLPIIKNIFHLSFVCNKGVAFGMFSNSNPAWILVFYVCVIAIVFIFSSHKKIFRQSKSGQVFLSLILAGAVGNLIDRVRFGFVIDFLDFRIWPVFNIADASITIGTVLLCLQILKHKD